jgi:hypothetical protein
MNHAGFLRLVENELAGVAAPLGPERREGAAKAAAEEHSGIVRDGREVLQSFAEGSRTAARAVSDLVDPLTHLASVLYAAGAQHIEWRHWSGLSAYARLLGSSLLEGARYAALGSEWECVGWLGGLAAPPLYTASDFALWSLVKGTALAGPATWSDPEAAAWSLLAHSFLAGDADGVERGLQGVAQFWMHEAEDWKLHETGMYPLFETPVCAAAALVRHAGFPVAGLSAEERSFLEPGLAPGDPEPLFPICEVFLR